MTSWVPMTSCGGWLWCLASSPLSFTCPFASSATFALQRPDHALAGSPSGARAFRHRSRGVGHCHGTCANLRSPEATGAMLVVFEPGIPADAIFASLTRAEVRVVRPSALGFIWIVTSNEAGLAGRLAREGAVGAYRDLPISPTIAGCFAFADAKVANLLQ